MDILLEVDNLRLERQGQQILRGVTFKVAAGQVYALLGRNGSGKSSLAYTLMGSSGYVPSGGHIRFAGEDISQLPITERARRGLTLAWQAPANFEGLTVRDYLGVGMKEPARERMEEALTAVALAPGPYLERTVDDNLSGGERKRIELAAVYVMQPQLAILDEPDSGIDVLSLDDIGRIIQRMASEGTTVLLITHRDEMVPISDVAALMCQGEIVRVGEPVAVREHYARRCRPCETAAPVEGPGGNYERL